MKAKINKKLFTDKYILVDKNDVRFLYPIKEYQFDSRYVCDNSGNVYLIKLDQGSEWLCLKIKPFTTSDGYVEYVLTTKYKKKKHVQAQRIVAYLYLIKPANKNYVNHKNGKRNDNYYKNLEWVTHSENITHSYRVLNRKVWNKGKVLDSKQT